MPISKYFKGHGEEVMADMVRKHGAKKGKQIFYATANKRNMKAMQRGGIVTGRKQDDDEELKALLAQGEPVDDDVASARTRQHDFHRAAIRRRCVRTAVQ